MGEEADVQESQGETHDFSAEERKDEVSVCVCVHEHTHTHVHACIRSIWMKEKKGQRPRVPFSMLSSRILSEF